MRYLLAAEADKIQEFVFRPSRLREVVGASQLLTRFCKEGIQPLLDKYKGKALVNDGGGFRIVFDGPEAEVNAMRFGEDLAELYRLVLGGSLSVAAPVELNGNFLTANKEAGKSLRRAKGHCLNTVAEPHMPYVAYCASCGVELAEEHDLLPGEKSEHGRYLCPICQTKAHERWDHRHGHLRTFLVETTGTEEDLNRFTWAEDADTIGRFDLQKRNYVAYLVADGNGMGQIFGCCDETQIKSVSERLTDVVRSCLAEVSATLIARIDRRFDEDDKEIVPVLPLILGGDDVFVLLPAPYALDFARKFCLAYERKMLEVVDEIGLVVPRPTMSAAIVICKSKYPYVLAHRRGDQLLKEAKHMSKRLAAHHGEQMSAVNFEVILDNRLAAHGDEDEDCHIRPSLLPYWVSENELSPAAQAYGLDLKPLLGERLNLNNVSMKRLHELRKLIANLPEPGQRPKRDAELAAWTRTLKKPITRSGHAKRLWQAMSQLGNQAPVPKDTAEWKSRGDKFHFWRDIDRDDSKSVAAHGFLDMLQVWHFAQDLKCGPEAYEFQEEEETT